MTRGIMDCHLESSDIQPQRIGVDYRLSRADKSWCPTQQHSLSVLLHGKSSSFLVVF